MTLRVLLTGFEPFAGEAVNPSVPATALLAHSPPPGIALRRLILPVTYAGAWPALRASLCHEPPDLLLMTGQGGGRAGLCVERVAINLDDAAVADNAGERRSDRPVLDAGPAAYFTTAPAKLMAAAAQAAGVPAAVSNSAGTFLCNHVLYRACHHAASEARALRCGFVHLPWLPEQAASRPGAPSLGVEAMAAGLRAALTAAAAALAEPEDLAAAVR